MAIRVRKDGTVVCAAKHPAEGGDLYLDDGIQHLLMGLGVIQTEDGGGRWTLASPREWSHTPPQEVTILREKVTKAEEERDVLDGDLTALGKAFNDITDRCGDHAVDLETLKTKLEEVEKDLADVHARNNTAEANQRRRNVEILTILGKTSPTDPEQTYIPPVTLARHLAEEKKKRVEAEEAEAERRMNCDDLMAKVEIQRMQLSTATARADALARVCKIGKDACLRLDALGEHCFMAAMKEAVRDTAEPPTQPAGEEVR